MDAVALVAGATRGAGRAIAVELARTGFHVYATGRSSRVTGRSEIDRPETIEETGDAIGAAGGTGCALVVDHEDSDAVASLIERIGNDHGRLRHSCQRHLRRGSVRRLGAPAVGTRSLGWAADASNGRGHAPHHEPPRSALVAPYG
ncbi:MAG: SDR family NAD(P)-dependent oxidoreductase [Nocardioidaceae bacterium]